MLRSLIISVLGICLTSALLADEPKSDKPAEPLPEVFSPPPFEVPPGFTVEVAASTPLVKHPIMAGFDDKGRLYVAESAGMNLPRVDLEKQLPNGIVRLEDTDGDGKFDKSTVFADKMTFPQGALWHDGSVYAASSGGIWKLTDLNDDGVADERQLLVSKFGYTGNAADVHGCFLGPDGRIYWCEGRHGHEITDKDGKLISKGKAARVFSCKTDGSDVQVFAGGGMDNPVEVDWTEEGEMLGTANIFYQKRGDTLIHWVRGGVYPRLDQPECLAEFPRTGEPLDAVHDFGHVAVSGCMRYRSSLPLPLGEGRGEGVRAGGDGEKKPDPHPNPLPKGEGIGFGPEYASNWFVTEFNTHKVKRCVLEREGSTFKATVHEFLKAKSDDFHPTDVLEDADGSLLVVDTGGWFRIGCPTSQIAKSHILGGIYRVRKTDAKKVEVARSKLPVAAHVVGKDWSFAELKQRVASDESMVNRRIAATSLGQLGKPEAIPDLFQGLTRPHDRCLEHALIYALIEINKRPETLKGLVHENPAVRRGALIALDQMRYSNLTRQEVVALLDTTDVPLQATAIGIIVRRQWTDDMITFIGRLLEEPQLTPAQQGIVANSLAGLLKDPKVQSLVAIALAKDLPATHRKLLLDVLSQGDLPDLPPELAHVVKTSLSSPDAAVLHAAVLAAKGESFDEPLLAIARDGSKSAETRLAAFVTAAGHKKPLNETDIGWLKTLVTQGETPLARISAARALGSAALTTDQLKVVAALISEVGPLELSPLLGAFNGVTDDSVGKELAASLVKSPGAGSLSLTQIESLLKPFSEEARQPIQPLVERLASAAKEQRTRLEGLLAHLGGGNPQAGRDIFVNKRAACTACHRVGDSGGKIGPDLTKVGERRSQRDLLEAILYPSASVGQGYETYVIQTSGGQTVTGLVTRRTADAIFLRTPDQKDIRLATSDIEQMKPSPVSIMPAGLENTMTSDQLRDLIAYLRSLK